VVFPPGGSCVIVRATVGLLLISRFAEGSAWNDSVYCQHPGEEQCHLPAEYVV
jgi:hypothetical protein